MDDEDGSAIVNRDDAIPVVRFPSRDSQSTTTHDDHIQNETISTPRGGKREWLASQIKGRLNGDGSPTIQDRLFSSLMAQIIPPEELSENENSGSNSAAPGTKDRRSRKYVDRPNFNIGLMSGNFRRFNSRIGIVFVFQNRLIHLFTWRHPPATLSFLAIYTLVCLDPAILPVLPLAGTLFFVMLPSLLVRHPVSTTDSQLDSSAQTFGPPIAPPSRVKPTPELSKDFFRNMRDLQNCMEDFSRMHDAANDYITPYTNFSDERTSSALFLFLFVLSIFAFVASHLMPYRLIALVGGWAALLACHPSAQQIILSSQSLASLQRTLSTVQLKVRQWTEYDILLDEPPEARQVEIFELQRHHAASDTWEAWLFSPSAYDPISQAITSRAKGTQFFEEVLPPAGWRWRDKKWSLDLFSREWVEQRMITGVEVETEGERWVYDIPAEVVEALSSTGSPQKGKKRIVSKSGWEEGSGREKRGLWRRRRWVRDVERVVIKRPMQKPKIKPLSTLDPGLIKPGSAEPPAVT